MAEPLRILIIEDSADDAELVARHLAGAGRTVALERIETAEQLRASLAARPPDAILADDRLPTFDAASALEVVRGRGLDIPFLVVSGTIGEVRAVELMRRGAHDYVCKDDLVRLVPALDRELREAHNRAARRDAERRRDQFLAMIGHELRNPLAPIVTALSLLQLRGQADSEEIRVIRRHVDHLQRLVDDLLDISRLTRGDFSLRRAPTDLGRVIKDAVEMASTLLDAKHHHLQLDLPAQAPIVDGDPDRLAQIVSNLVTNAAKYTPTGGHITIAVHAVASDALITVTDNGVGIDPEVLPHVFEPFVQGDRARDRCPGGLGLGLSIVKSLVELHGGSIAIDSALGRGTHVTVRLPVATAMTRAAPPVRQLERAQSDQRVLVVDDNIDAANLLCEFLSDLGFETRAAHDGPSALAMSKDFRPTLALLDIGLPIMDGYELGTRLRRDHDQLRMIAITGYGDVADRRRSEQAGFEDHLVKPIDLARLVHTLRA